MVESKLSESHVLCHDSATHEAWVAKKNGEFRCFLERKEFPHQVRGSNLD